MINYTQKFIVLLQVLNVVIRNNEDFDKILEEFALIALEYEMDILAYKVLLFAGEKNFRIMELKDLIYHSNEEVSGTFKPPPFPFKMEAVSLKNQNKIDQKKKQPEVKPIFTSNNQGNQPPFQPHPQDHNRSGQKPDMFVPSKGQQPVKGFFILNNNF